MAAFANADEGDVVAAGGNANSAPGFEGSKDEWQNVIRDGSLQLNKALELWDQGKPVSGPIDTRARWINLAGYEVAPEFTQGAGKHFVCPLEDIHLLLGLKMDRLIYRVSMRA